MGAGSLDQLQQRGNAVVAGLVVLGQKGTQLLKFSQCIITHIAAAVGHALERIIVKEHNLVIAGKTQICLQGKCALSQRHLKRTQRILRRLRHDAAMGHHKRLAARLSRPPKLLPLHNFIPSAIFSTSQLRWP